MMLTKYGRAFRRTSLPFATHRPSARACGDTVNSLEVRMSGARRRDVARPERHRPIADIEKPHQLGRLVFRSRSR